MHPVPIQRQYSYIDPNKGKIDGVAVLVSTSITFANSDGEVLSILLGPVPDLNRIVLVIHGPGILPTFVATDTQQRPDQPRSQYAHSRVRSEVVRVMGYDALEPQRIAQDWLVGLGIPAPPGLGDLSRTRH
jgi:hypothetical protein